MIEDSAVANFEKTHIDAPFIQREIERQRTAGVLPDLRGIVVFVAGARAEPLERAAAIENFSRQYFTVTGAEIGPGGYSRTLPSFDQ